MLLLILMVLLLLKMAVVFVLVVQLGHVRWRRKKREVGRGEEEEDLFGKPLWNGWLEELESVVQGGIGYGRLGKGGCTCRMDWRG